jgi:DNA-binding NtrC family response regulator
MGRILIADDHDALRRGLARGLAAAGHEVEEASNGNAAIERLHDGYFDVVLSDLRMGGSDGLDVLRTAKALHPTTAVILMTAFGSVTTAVEAMKIGAFDYVQKPFEIEEMEVKIEKALELKRMRNELDYLRHTQQDIYQFDRIVGSSPALERVLDMVKKVAKSNTTVLIRGETGTGKELIAGAIHHNSLRSARNFVKVNCAALQENLLESELFGHEKGAFTGADKQRIGRFEQAGRFREDLYYRLNVVSIEMPPLRERKEDIVPLATFFIRRFAGELKKKTEGLEPEAQKLLMRYNWPGNVRELENTIERAMLLAEGPAIAASDLRLGDVPTAGTARDQTSVVKIPPTGIPLDDIERCALIEALKMSNWVQKDAAELLSISPRVMNYKIKTLGIDFPRGRRAQPVAPPPPPEAVAS